ncbi:MAG: FRG domain-containing protein [Lachnospiraceae bacterium]|nr:FRG domain-containing protein [Lachnospiraceae bacterium]
MIKEIKIDKIEDLIPLFTEQDYRPDLKRNRGMYIYRGMSDAGFKMHTSLSRTCKGLQKELEPAILENFAKYAVASDPLVADSVWRQIIVGQHYGLPTRLLDWTHSPLVGLHFATCEENLELMDKHDCVVWRMDMAEMLHNLPEKYREEVNKKQSTVFSVELLKKLTNNSLSQYDIDMKDEAMVTIEPPSLDERIVNQYSFFSVIPMGITDIEAFLDRKTEKTVKYVIDKSLRWRVRDMLDQMNISERIVYPGLSGLSKWIARHYYVM